MSKVQVVQKEIFYTVFKDLDFHMYDSMAEAINNNDVLFILKKVIGHNPVTTNNYGLMNNYAAILKLYDPQGTELNMLEENGWEMKMDLFGFTAGYHYTTMWVEFKDTFNLKQKEAFGISVEDFLKAYRRFKKLNIYQGYKLATVTLENEVLKHEIVVLKDKVNALSTELKSLQERLSQMG